MIRMRGNFYAQNQYTKDFATALYKSNKTVLIENLNTLSDTYSKYKNSLFAKDTHLYTDGTYINFSLPVGSEPTVYVYANGTITIDN